MSFAEFMSKPREKVFTEYTQTEKLKTSVDYRTISVSEQALREKYTPRSLLELCGFRTEVTSQVDIPAFEKMCSGNKGFCVVIQGPTGSGKTTVSNVIAKNLGLHVTRFNSSNVISREAFINSLHLISIQNDPKSLVLISDLSEILKYTSEIYQKIIEVIKKGNVKIVLESNSSVDKKYTELKKYSKELCLLAPNLTNKTLFIIQKETGVKLTSEQLAALNNLTQNDFNQMYFAVIDLITRINQEQSLANSEQNLELESETAPGPEPSQAVGLESDQVEKVFKQFLDNFNRKRVDYTIFELTKKAFESTPEENLVNYYSSTSVLPLMVHENYPIYAPEKGSEIIAEYISDSDLMYPFLFKTSDEDFQSGFGMTAVSAPIEFLEGSKKRGIKTEAIHFTTYLQKSASLSNRSSAYSETGLEIETVNAILPLLQEFHKTKETDRFDQLLNTAVESCVAFEPSVCKMALLKLARIKLTKGLKQRLGLEI